MGAKAPVEATKSETISIQTNEDNGDESTTIKKSKEHTKKDRVYRKRQSSGPNASDEEDDEASAVDTKSVAKKAHLQCNLDADSDFSIDSDSDEEEKDSNANAEHNPTELLTKSETTTMPNEAPVEDEKVEKVAVEKPVEEAIAEVQVEEKVEPKIDRKKIWEKRTVGDVLLGAIQRYFERKQLREG